jgi:hypothetical protein
MQTATKELIVAVGLGVVIGSMVASSKARTRYNALVRDYNMVVERDAIKSRVFKEIMPQLPDDYNLTEQTMVDIKSFNMFMENDL